MLLRDQPRDAAREGRFQYGSSAQPTYGLGLHGAEAESAYPATWKISLGAAVRALPRPLLLPHTTDANSSNAVAAFLFPGSQAVALEFPPPKAGGSSPPAVRQQYLEVYEGPWMEPEDPATFFANDLANDPAVGFSLCRVNGLPAECQTANSPSDDEGVNPAFVRTVIGGNTEIHVSGGDDLQRLLEIASSLTAAGGK